MCRCPKNPYPPPPADSISLLLELSAADDLSAFKLTLKSTNLPLGSSAPWYSRSISPSLQMGYHLRTPLQISALYGSTSVLTYILSLKPADVNLPSVSDGATALHLAAGGGAAASLQTVKLLIEASADVDAVDAMGNRPGDVIAKQLSASTVRELEVILKAPPYPRVSSPKEKKEYPMDSTLPDIKNGIYGTDEFRMYDFKVRPCCRAYSHDWTECPFVHPGENARRRDVRKYCYSCVPCPEFRKGGCCLKGDACEYAHGVFESWLHPAQYRTRLCKDEVGCSRRVCFFAHRRDELRSVNPAMASVSGLGISSPMGVSSLDMAAALMMMQQTPGTPPMSISASSSMRPLSSRLSFRDLDFDPDLMGIEGFQQKLLDEISMNWRANSLKQAAGNFTGQQLLTGYGSNLNLNLNLSSSPGLNSSSSFGVDHSMAKAIVNSREAAFAKRSQSFIDHTVLASPPSFGLCDWVSPDGKLDWGIHGDELNKLRKSATFNLRSNVSWPKAQAMAGHVIPPIGRHQKQNQGNGAGDYLSWEQLYAEQEQLVA